MLKKKNMAAVLVTVSVLMCAVLCGCGTVKNSGYQTSVSVPAPVAEDHEESVPASASTVEDDSYQPAGSVSAPTAEDHEESVPAPAPAAHSTVKDRMKSYRDGQKNNSEDATSETGTVEQNSEDARPEIATVEQASGYDVETIAKIADMTANIEKIGYKRLCVICTEDEYNPYDVTWNYGRKYDKFVKAVDDAGMWDVLFDAEFYKAHYPMLALQYHDNDVLLLEHFQTVGVHEGRQGSEAFNVASYMENCDDGLVRAFSEHYECYYFYWALNQDSESGINAKSDGHPLQMCVKLTGLQAYELRRVNEYRAEVGADPVKAAPSLWHSRATGLCAITPGLIRHTNGSMSIRIMLIVFLITGTLTKLRKIQYPGHTAKVNLNFWTMLEDTANRLNITNPWSTPRTIGLVVPIYIGVLTDIMAEIIKAANTTSTWIICPATKSGRNNRSLHPGFP